MSELKFVVLLVFFLAVLEAALGKPLIYVNKPSGHEGLEYYAKLSKNLDVRGDFGTFALVVGHDYSVVENVVFEQYDPSVYLYVVAEDANVEGQRTSSHELIFRSFTNVNVAGKHVFQVEKSREDLFVSFIPPFLEIVHVSESALPSPALAFESVLSAAPDPKILGFVNQVTTAALKGYVTYLSGEDTNSPIQTRQATSPGAALASQYLQQVFTKFGFTVELQQFRSGYSPNVIAKLPGTTDPTRLLLVTAHYDDRASNVNSPTDRAPGANDNGSGTGALLQIAQLIADNKISFAYSVVLIAFGGEEQGLYGSEYAARQYKAQNADIIAVLNGDMLAYRASNEVPQLAFVSRSSTLSLNTVLANISSVYVNGLTLGTTTACCTDHSSFYSQGYPATSYYERNGNIVDPQYHKVGDLVNRAGYDIDVQYPAIVKSIFAAVLTLAKYQ